MGIPDSVEVTKKIITPQISAHQEEEILNYTFAVEESNSGTFIGLFGLNYGVKKNEELKCGTNCIRIIEERDMQLRR
jgi:hypothetical protein